MSNFVDYHCHLIPSIDDGAADLGEALQIATILHNVGFREVHCTSHCITGVYENGPARVLPAVAALQAELHRAGIELTLVPGGEHYLDESLLPRLAEWLRVGNTPFLLVEAPFSGAGDAVLALARGLLARGVRPLFAHPERCQAFAAPPRGGGIFGSLASLFRRRTQSTEPSELLHGLKEAGCAFQGNLGSFAGVYGKEVRERALRFLRDGVYSCLGSDAHRPERLESVLRTGIAAVVAEVGEETLSRLMAGADLRRPETVKSL